MTGQARFYPTTSSLAALGFGNAGLAVAGGLPSRATEPSASLPGAAAGVVSYTVTATWDSASRGRVYTTVT